MNFSYFYEEVRIDFDQVNPVNISRMVRCRNNLENIIIENSSRNAGNPAHNYNAGNPENPIPIGNPYITEATESGERVEPGPRDTRFLSILSICTCSECYIFRTKPKT